MTDRLTGRLALSDVDQHAQPKFERSVVIFGRVLTHSDVLALSRALHERGDYEGGLRVLHAAGLSAHDLVEADREPDLARLTP
jgi:hypothetical protein